MFVGVGYSDLPDSTAAGIQAAEQAVGMSGRGVPCDVVLLFCTVCHGLQPLRDAVSAVVGAAVPIYGGDVVGSGTNDSSGDVGYRVEVVCLWLDGARLDAMIEGDAAGLQQTVANRVPDAQLAGVRYALELKRRGFRLLSELVASLHHLPDEQSVFARVAERVNAALDMQKTVVLVRNGDGRFQPMALHGCSDEDRARLEQMAGPLSDELIRLCPVAVTQEEGKSGCFSQLCELCGLPFLIASPVWLQGEPIALLLTGRMERWEPYLTELGTDNLETVSAITDLVGSVLEQLRLQKVVGKAEIDDLTGLWNRATFQARVERYLSNGDDHSGAFMMIDLDHFKTVNDTYGHVIGDKVLRACADAIQSVMRDSDFVGRQGGDEFAVFYRDIKSAAAAIKKADQIRAAWRCVVPDGGTDCITASIGIALSPMHGRTFQTLYGNADRALYRAKACGKDCCALYDPDLQEDAPKLGPT